MSVTLMEFNGFGFSLSIPLVNLRSINGESVHSQRFFSFFFGREIITFQCYDAEH